MEDAVKSTFVAPNLASKPSSLIAASIIPFNASLMEAADSDNASSCQIGKTRHGVWREVSGVCESVCVLNCIGIGSTFIEIDRIDSIPRSKARQMINSNEVSRTWPVMAALDMPLLAWFVADSGTSSQDMYCGSKVLLPVMRNLQILQTSF